MQTVDHFSNHANVDTVSDSSLALPEICHPSYDEPSSSFSLNPTSAAGKVKIPLSLAMADDIARACMHMHE